MTPPFMCASYRITVILTLITNMNMFRSPLLSCVPDPGRKTF